MNRAEALEALADEVRFFKLGNGNDGKNRAFDRVCATLAEVDRHEKAEKVVSLS